MSISDDLRTVADIARSRRCPCGRMGCDLAGVRDHTDPAWRALADTLVERVAALEAVVDVAEDCVEHDDEWDIRLHGWARARTTLRAALSRLDGAT